MHKLPFQHTNPSQPIITCTTIYARKKAEVEPRGQFYLFVGVEGGGIGEIPDAARVFLGLPFLGQPLDASFTLEQIRSMVSGDVEVKDYARRIPYRVPQSFWAVDPFDQVDRGAVLQVTEEDALLRRSQAFERFVLWLSAVGSGTWPSFQAACHVLGIDTPPLGQAPPGIIRRLRLLGHVETSRDGTHWTVTQPSLVRRDAAESSDSTRYIFCGGRDTGLLASMARGMSLDHVPQPHGLGPPAILAGLPDEHLLPRLLQDLSGGVSVNFEPDAALRLANLLPPIDSWLDTLDELPGVMPYLFDCRKYDGEAFIDVVFRGENGFYELRPALSAPDAHLVRPTYSAFYDDSRRRWLRGDWYGLRFMAQTALGTAYPIEYDASTRRLAVPTIARWPEAYERALVLGSGELPSSDQTQTWLIYQSVSESLVAILASKLNLRIDLRVGMTAGA